MQNYIGAHTSWNFPNVIWRLAWVQLYFRVVAQLVKKSWRNMNQNVKHLAWKIFLFLERLLQSCHRWKLSKSCPTGLKLSCHFYWDRFTYILLYRGFSLKVFNKSCISFSRSGFWSAIRNGIFWTWIFFTFNQN